MHGLQQVLPLKFLYACFIGFSLTETHVDVRKLKYKSTKATYTSYAELTMLSLSFSL